jgi:hypothetical protein
MGCTFPGETKYRAALGIDYASGDDNPADDDYNAFDNLYYTGHKFRGYMDLFTPSNTEGLMDVYLRQGLSPAKDWTLAGDVHLFRTAAGYRSVKDGKETKARGLELDVLARTTKLQKAILEVGGSVFFPSEDWQGKDADPALWGYAMVTVKLP